jgi:hypothetical protein
LEEIKEKDSSITRLTFFVAIILQTITSANSSILSKRKTGKKHIQDDQSTKIKEYIKKNKVMIKSRINPYKK